MMTVLTSFYKVKPILAGLGLFLVFNGPALATDTSSNLAVPFAIALVHSEHNATDGDTEVVFDVKSGHDGLTELTVVSPKGRPVIHFSVPDPSALGVRQFRFESPEPKTIQNLKSAYPEGVYTFMGVTAAGGKLLSQSSLSYRLIAMATGLWPGDRVEGVPATDVIVTWQPVKNSAGFILEIKQDETDIHLTAKLPGSATAFAVPTGSLVPAMICELSLGAITEEGNITFVESRFSTAEKD